MVKFFWEKKYPIHCTPNLKVCQVADGPRISIISDSVELEDGKAPEDQKTCRNHPLTKSKRRLGHQMKFGSY